MDTARRDEYLTALGVVRYRPRPAPGEAAATSGGVSAQSFATDLAPTAPSSAAAPARAPSSSVAEVERGESPLAALREQTQAPVTVARAAPEVPPQPATATASAEGPAALAFRLACWQPVPDLLVFDAMPAGSWPDRERMTLLANILRAIGRLPGPLAAAEVIDWPPFGGADASLAGARESLALFIAGRMATAPFKWLLALGEISWRCLGAESAHTVGAELTLAGAARAILLPGLADMLASPERKAETWRAIRQLAPAAN